MLDISDHESCFNFSNVKINSFSLLLSLIKNDLSRQNDESKGIHLAIDTKLKR